MYSSYKDLPVSLYQIQIKYRDEARPRAGILRGREFVMKDSYSFDLDEAGLDKSYQQHRDAYIKIFDRLGFHYVIVQAMAGAMGGSKSRFLATAENGEDTYVRCANCGYAANVEAVQVAAPDPIPYADLPASHVEDTPDTPTIETLVTHLNSAFPARTEPGRPGTPSRMSSSCSSTPMAAAPRSSSASPVTVTSTRSAWVHRWSRRSSRPSRRPTSRHTLVEEGYIGPEVLGEASESGSATSSTHGSSTAVRG